LRWKSKQYKDIAVLIASAVGKIGIEVATAMLLGAEIGILTGVFWSINICRQIEALFKEAKKLAKETGRLLGVALACGWPFTKQTVSLLGFSLGGQVVKSCLKCLE
jgi:hypothetical protein